MRWGPYGPDAFLVQFADQPGDWAFHKCRAIVEYLTANPPPGLREFVPGYTSILLEFHPMDPAELGRIAGHLAGEFEAATKNKIPPGPIHKIPVRYDGPDLDRVARHNRISITHLVKYHTSRTYTVLLLGFAPGFPYLGELHHKLRTPRLSNPRVKVPAGSVAIGGQQTGIYPVESPGGWNIIGHTDVKIFDLQRLSAGRHQDAFFLQQGDRVQFVAL